MMEKRAAVSWRDGIFPKVIKTRANGSFAFRIGLMCVHCGNKMEARRFRGLAKESIAKTKMKESKERFESTDVHSLGNDFP